VLINERGEVQDSFSYYVSALTSGKAEDTYDGDTIGGYTSSCAIIKEREYRFEEPELMTRLQN